ncbi:hypothetical protein AQ808_16235 [Burkholderia pseudomallei]|nr:hypothetical protein BHL98_24430 [Burkholderia mallei]APY98130.1 hypothetical protein BGI49_03545 [Burkholderia pseudomallei]APZ11713.1 hypothetical protein BGI52_03545 [Burkholderia pseudomallei]OMT50510.1 hypothetical protein AQ760_27515 [Burkholderia pseudomallei]OMW50470.1 hypothetical protein AQ808_16235 [Burkholderia pseudomallei]
MPSSAERAARLDARVVAATTHVGERRDRARRAAPAFGANQTSANKTGAESHGGARRACRRFTRWML